MAECKIVALYVYEEEVSARKEMHVGILDEILTEVNRGGGAWTVVFDGLPDGGSKTVRFYSHGDWVMPVVMHEKFQKGRDVHGNFLGYRVICPVQKFYKTQTPMFPGKTTCPYCGRDGKGEGEQKTFRRYCWLLWSHDDGQLQVYAFNAGKKGPTPKVLAAAQLYAKKRSDITGRDCEFSRSGEGFASEYQVHFGDREEYTLPSGIDVPETKEVQHQLMVQMLVDAWCPQLKADGDLSLLGKAETVDDAVENLLNGTARLVYADDEELLPRE